MNPTLTSAELRRYSRHLKLGEVGVEGQLKLKKARVLVIGAGGLGSPCLLYLAAAGVGCLTIVDGDQVDDSNLQRQVLFDQSDLGQNKAEAAARHLAQLNPCIQVLSKPYFVNQDNVLDLLVGQDLVVDGSDNFATRYLMDAACGMQEIPLVYGALYKFSGQISVFHWRGGPSYRCLYPDEPGAEALPACGEVGVLGVVPGVIGAMQATEALKIILGIGEVASGVLVLVDVLTWDVRRIRFKRHPEYVKPQSLAVQSFACDTMAQDQGLLTWTPLELESYLESGQPYLLLDVREDWERELAPMIGATVWQDPMDLPVQPALETQVIVFCHRGVRSQRKALTLLQAGWSNVGHLQGGIDAWALQIDPDMERY